MIEWSWAQTLDFLPAAASNVVAVIAAGAAWWQAKLAKEAAQRAATLETQRLGRVLAELLASGRALKSRIEHVGVDLDNSLRSAFTAAGQGAGSSRLKLFSDLHRKQREDAIAGAAALFSPELANPEVAGASVDELHARTLIAIDCVATLQAALDEQMRALARIDADRFAARQ